MSDYGKKVGVFYVETVLARYALDVRLSVATSEFAILVPHVPGAKVNRHESSTYEAFKGTSLDELKKAVKDSLTARDVTEYEDVIEYEYESRYSSDDGGVVFDFRIARVSLSRDEHGGAKLEKVIDVGEDGAIVEETSFDGVPFRPTRHRRDFDHSMPFTVERWRKCRAIRDGIEKLNELLKELLGGDDAPAKLDALRAPLLLLGEGVASKRKRRGSKP